MRILITGAGGNVGKGITARLRAAGHELVLADLNRLPDAEPYRGLTFVQGDAQIGEGFERAARDCDVIVHTAAWHGIHMGAKTEADFWRLNIDGTFWMFQAAVAAKVKRVVFLSSQAWHGHYDKYAFTKVVGEELCEYNRRNHGIRYVAIRPADFTPWGDNFVNNYGLRLLYGGVDREDVLDCIQRSIETLGATLPAGKEAEGLVANRSRRQCRSRQRFLGGANRRLGNEAASDLRKTLSELARFDREIQHQYRAQARFERLGRRCRRHWLRTATTFRHFPGRTAAFRCRRRRGCRQSAALRILKTVCRHKAALASTRNVVSAVQSAIYYA